MILMKRYFCTLFDKNYLIKGLTMIFSLAKYCEEFTIFVLCIDDKTKEILEKINCVDIKCIKLNDVENDELKIAKKNRTIAEYCWTLASSFTWHVIQSNKDIDLITYLDADIFFYSDVEPIFKEIGNASIAIIEHRFSPPLNHLEINGKFCVEWNSFRRDKEGLHCLDIWRKQCLDWCYYKLENNKMGDQKYLDSWPNKYPNCHIIKEVGAGIAPWNYSQYSITKKDKEIKINNQKLIFYHFHQFQILNNYKFYRLGETYTDIQKEPDLIYEIYEKEIIETIKIIRGFDSKFIYGINKKNLILKNKIKSLLPKKIKIFIRRYL
tara:strand:- start:357 stop:1325 length:969 start_codon:yes stop_codon:yes gene_type:complete